MKKMTNILIVLLASFLSINAFSKEKSLDHIVAVVNHKLVLESEMATAMDQIKKQLSATHTPLPLETVLKKQVLDQLINKKLQLELAEQAGIEPSEADIDRAIKNIAANNKLSTEQLYKELALRGVDKSEYRDEIHDQFILQQVQHQAIGNKITVSEQEVDDFMRSAAWLASNNKEYHLQDILIALPETPSPEDVKKAEQRADNIIKKLKNGLSFREAAVAESSNDKALQGGDLGWRKLPEVPSAFATQILPAKADDILGPIQAPNGFHIIHLAGIRNVNMQGNPNDQHKQVQRLIFERKYEEALQNWMTKIRSEAFINVTQEG